MGRLQSYWKLGLPREPAVRISRQLCQDVIQRSKDFPVGFATRAGNGIDGLCFQLRNSFPLPAVISQSNQQVLNLYRWIIVPISVTLGEASILLRYSQLLHQIGAARLV